MAEGSRVGVVGVGSMGANHARVYDRFKHVDLVAVADRDLISAEAVADRYKCAAYADFEQLLGKVDAVSVAVPTSMHLEVGLFFLRHGVHCLIEKPLAPTESDCLALIEAAAEGGAILQVGHIERYNPSVDQLRKIIDPTQVVHGIEARRMSAVSSRITDVDVVLDLMIHDIDVVLCLVRRPVHEVEAFGFNGDYVSATLAFEGGMLATLIASRVTQNKIRSHQVSTAAGLYDLDYSNQSLQIFRQKTQPQAVRNSVEGAYQLDLSVDRVLVPHGEPLNLELTDFLDCVETGRTPEVDGEEALKSLRLAWTIQERLKRRSG